MDTPGGAAPSEKLERFMFSGGIQPGEQGYGFRRQPVKPSGPGRRGGAYLKQKKKEISTKGHEAGRLCRIDRAVARQPGRCPLEEQK